MGNSLKDLRGSSGRRANLVKKILNDRALKIAIISIFVTTAIRHFQSEIKTLLMNDIFKHVCVWDVDGQLKVMCDIIHEHELNLRTKFIKSLIISNKLT